MDGPVFLRLEILDLDLPLGDESKRRALNPSRGKPRPHLAPKKGGKIEADKVIERPSRLLGIDERHGNFPGMGHGFLHGRFGDLVENHPAQRLRIQLGPGGEYFRNMPGYRLPFPVRVGCEIDSVGMSRRPGDFLDMLRIPLDQLVIHGEMVFGIHRPLFRNEVPDMTEARDDLEILAEIFLQGLCLRRRLDDE